MGLLELDIHDLRKKALIKFSVKPEGHVFGIHRLTGGAELALDELSRSANRLIIKLQNVQKGKEFDEKEFSAITDEIEKLEADRMKVKASVFDDGGDGSLSIALIKELTPDEVTRIVQAVEAGLDIIPKEDEAPEDTSNAKTA